MSEQIVYPITDPQEWAKRYNISTDQIPCENCGKLLDLTKPFAAGSWRGLESEPHGCDEAYNIFVATKNTPAGRQEYINYFNTLKAELGGDNHTPEPPKEE